MNTAADNKRNRLVLMLITLLFFAPLLLAVLMQSPWWNFQTGTATNSGILLDPPVPLNLGALEPAASEGATPGEIPGKWLMFYPFPGVCDSVCERAIVGLRQIHKATGRHRTKVAIVLFSTAPVEAGEAARLLEIHPDFILARDSTGQSAELLGEVISTAKAGPAELAGWGFLLDPGANIILTYPPGYSPSQINQDLKRLLKWSTGN